MLAHCGVSPIGVVPKRTPGEYHCIQHLSYLNGASINDGTPVEHSSVTLILTMPLAHFEVGG